VPKCCSAAGLAAFEKALEDKKLDDDKRRTTQTLKGELLRRLGKFADAKDHFDRLAKDELFKAQPFPEMIQQELEWIAKDNDQPQEWKDAK